MQTNEPASSKPTPEEDARRQRAAPGLVPRCPCARGPVQTRARARGSSGFLGHRCRFAVWTSQDRAALLRLTGGDGQGPRDTRTIISAASTPIWHPVYDASRGAIITAGLRPQRPRCGSAGRRSCISR